MGRAGILGILAVVVVVLTAVGCGASTEPVASGWSAVRWERIDPSPGRDGPLDVVAFGGRYVGVGAPSAWTSTDLRTWEELALDTFSQTIRCSLSEYPAAANSCPVTSTNSTAPRSSSEERPTWERRSG